MARRTHEELIEALAVFDMSIESPPSELALNKRWKQLIVKVHSDTPGGSEFLSKQLNLSRDLIKEWLDAGRPQWPQGRQAEAEKTAAQNAREKAARERAEERARAEKARADRAEEKLRKAEEAEGGMDDFANAKEVFGDALRKQREEKERAFREIDRRRRRRGQFKLGLVLGSIMVVIGLLYRYQY